jgi:hypothetical protein
LLEIRSSQLAATSRKTGYGPLGPYRFRFGADSRSGHGGGQLHLLRISYEPASALLGEASSLLNAALRESPGRNRPGDQ